MGELVSNDGEPINGQPGSFAAMTDAALVIAGGKVAWTGPASRAPAADAVVDVGGRAVLPGFADSHAHLVFAGERSAEFAARMAGRPYRAGGILGTVEATRAASDAVLRANLRRSEEHTSELQPQSNIVCRLLLEKKKTHYRTVRFPPTPHSQS